MHNTEPSFMPILSTVNQAFSKQSVKYDEDDSRNQVLQDMRKQVYAHVSEFLKEKSHVLELNAGTGIDALHFVQQGHSVHATDLSDGMIAQLEKKIVHHQLHGRLACQQISYEHLEKLDEQKFDYVFSNFGGLNCIDDVSRVTKNLPSLLNPGAHVTWVIMPPVCIWEILGVFKGHFKQAFRRFHKDGVMAHLEGEYFKTYYHSLSQIKKAFGAEFKFIKSEGLCLVSPPPSRANFPIQYPKLYRSLQKLDSQLRESFPFNRWGDHIIVTFQFRSER